MASLFEKEIKVRVTFVEPVLGSEPNTEEIYREFVASKAPDALSMEEEIAAMGSEMYEEKGTTVFARDGNTACLWDYQIRGFFKGSCGGIQKAKGRKTKLKSQSVKAYKKVIDNNIFVFPRRIPLNLPEGKTIENAMTINQRPLRAQTAQGERIALASSEQLPAGTWFEITIGLLDATMEDVVMEWLDFGKLNGIGQWRNASYGRFDYEVVD